MVHTHKLVLPMKQTKESMSRSTPCSLRASVSFPPETYRTIEDIAKQNKVSVAWVIRDAVEEYVSDQWPLFGQR